MADSRRKQRGSKSRIHASEFHTSVFDTDQLPDTGLPEIAFAGRSNVGKSSLMNRILNRRNLVKVSARPGFTQSLNFFLVNNSMYFVDLPGYGFARAPRKIIHKWHRLVEGYMESSRQLRCIICIMDIRRRPDPLDIDLLNYLHATGHMACLVLNKSDKVSRPRRKARLDEICSALPGCAQNPLVVSARTGEGVPALVDTIMEMIDIS